MDNNKNLKSKKIYKAIKEKQAAQINDINYKITKLERRCPSHGLKAFIEKVNF